MAQPVTETRLPKTLGPRQIVELAERRKAAFGVRDEAYNVYLNYYRGKQAAGGPSVMAANSQGRPLLRVVGESMRQQRAYSSQRLAPIVDDAQALLGRMPASRVEPPDQEPSGLARGEKLTKFLISTHELSQMDRQQADMGFHLPCLGDGCYVLSVDPDVMRVVWEVVDPTICYPSFMWGYRRFDMLDLIIHYTVDAYVAMARWGIGPEDDKDDDRVPVTLYISQYQRTRVVGRDSKLESVEHVEWSLNFCPAVWVFNKVNGAFAQSDIAQSLVQQDALDFLWAVRLDGAVHLTYPIIGVKNPINVGQDGIVVGPGAPPVPLQQDGDIVVKNTQGDIGAINSMADSIEQELYAATGTSQARQQGQLHSSIQTGRAIHASQGPQATRVELKQTELGSAIQRANAMTLEMQEKAPFIGKRELEIFGRYRGESFRETLKPAEDINGWYRNSVFWEPVTGMNLQQKVAIAYEGKAAGLWDSARAMELVGVEDPMGMVKRVEDEKAHEAQLQMQMQQGMMPGASGEAQPGGGGGPQPPSPQAPPGQQQSTPLRIARPYDLGAQQPSLPTGVPKGVTIDAVTKALTLVASKLKGTVALIGELAQQGTGQHIQVLISRAEDYSRVLPVLRALDPQAQVKQMSEDRWPKEALRVV